MAWRRLLLLVVVVIVALLVFMSAGGAATTTVDVKHYGAKGNGVDDDTKVVARRSFLRLRFIHLHASSTC